MYNEYSAKLIARQMLQEYREANLAKSRYTAEKKRRTPKAAFGRMLMRLGYRLQHA